MTEQLSLALVVELVALHNSVSLPGNNSANKSGTTKPLKSHYSSNYQFPPVDFLFIVEVKIKIVQLCPTIFNPMDYTVHGIL